MLLLVAAAALIGHRQHASWQDRLTLHAAAWSQISHEPPPHTHPPPALQDYLIAEGNNGCTTRAKTTLPHTKYFFSQDGVK